ncbi:MAG: phytanoyl-CoA dioxygenase family protein [Candidatus Hodarchaeales archaeon]
MYDQFYKKGYQIFEGILNANEIEYYIKYLIEKIDKQETKYGSQILNSIGELNTIRSPFLDNSQFINLFFNDFSRKIVKDLLGEYAILSLQNAIIVQPNKIHHQSFYHRDLIYQDFTSSRPLSINIYYCLTDYNKDNGGIVFLEKSHKSDTFEKESLESIPEIKAGSVVLFDSMIYHKAGNNINNKPRIGINNMFTLPFIKQQIRYPSVMDPTGCEILDRILGFESLEHLNVKEFLNYRIKKKNDKK